MDSLLTVDQLGRCLSEKWLWRNVSFDLKPGSKLGVFGPSGIGKSLLMRSLIGLDAIDEGEITYLGRSIQAWHKPELRTQVIYLAQTPGILEGTVEDNLRAIFALKGYRDRRYDSLVVQELLAQLGRGETFVEQQTTRLSGGEKQLLGLVRALQMNPKILLLDEPTASLDPQTSDEVEKLLLNWVGAAPSEDRAYLWISHSPEQIQRVTSEQLDLGYFAV